MEDLPRVAPEDSIFARYSWEFNPDSLVPASSRQTSRRLDLNPNVQTTPQQPASPPHHGMRTIQEWASLVREHIQKRMAREPYMTIGEQMKLLSLEDFHIEPSVPAATTLHINLPDNTEEAIPVPSDLTIDTANAKLHQAEQPVIRAIGSVAATNVIAETERVITNHNREIMSDDLHKVWVMNHFVRRIPLSHETHHQRGLPLPTFSSSPEAKIARTSTPLLDSRPPSISPSSWSASDIASDSPPQLPRKLAPHLPAAPQKEMRYLLSATLTSSAPEALFFTEEASKNPIVGSTLVKQTYGLLHDWLAAMSFKMRTSQVFKLRNTLACIHCHQSVNMAYNQVTHNHRCVAYALLASFTDTVSCQDGLHHLPQYSAPLYYRLVRNLRISHPLRQLFSCHDGVFTPLQTTWLVDDT
ncbi:hypothetical protein [Wuhan cricket virus 2]|uniref:hypothetical protein n=1 Tax=Wuhan cricket virus 2 TaxID=1923697 RepID=UPI00090AAA80|nr:hypothetical protein [Wuhan cricket virus 2]APG78327.1 hypothetical protein [Wuhan cricket virus 2]APG78362.1 hypothetical protein [Wuhan cricket virus 2]